MSLVNPFICTANCINNSKLNGITWTLPFAISTTDFYFEWKKKKISSNSHKKEKAAETKTAQRYTALDRAIDLIQQIASAHSKYNSNK